MKLYLCRHGIAEDGEPGKDAARALTEEGVKRMRQAARGFLAQEPEVSHVLTSPLLRARQTAEIVAEALAREKIAAELEIVESLGLGADLRKFLAAIGKLRRCRGVVAVGHEPTMGEWIGELCFGGAGHVEMKKGAMAAIEMEGRRGTLLWVMQPGQLRGLAHP